MPEEVKSPVAATSLDIIQNPIKNVALSPTAIVPEVLNSISTSVENTITASATQQISPVKPEVAESMKLEQELAKVLQQNMEQTQNMALAQLMEEAGLLTGNNNNAPAPAPLPANVISTPSP